MTDRRRPLLVGLAVLALSIVPAACGDDDEEPTSAGEETTETASAEAVTVTTSDTADGYTWDVSPTPTAETKSVEFVNDSDEEHALIFAKLNEGFTVDEAFELQGEKGSTEPIGETGAPPGGSASIEVKNPLEPGDYVLLCPIAGPDGPHYKLGQLEEFAIS